MPDVNPRFQKTWLLVTVLILEILTGAEVDLFLPSFPEIQGLFGLSPFLVELTLSVNLIAHCLTSLVVGELGDRYGRRPIILLGLIVFIAGSVYCVLAASYWHLLLGRALQGIGISAPAVLAYVIVADLYSPQRQQQIMGALNGSITLAMAGAPIAGSYITLFFGWRGNFMMLLIFGIIAGLFSFFCIPKYEHTSDRHTAKSIYKEYRVVLTSKRVWLYILVITCLSLTFWCFISLAPILYMEDLGVSLEHFGFYQGALCFFFAVGCFSSDWCIRKWGARKCFMSSVWILVCYFFANLVLLFGEVKNPLIITFVMLIETVGIVVPVNFLYPLFLEIMPQAKGKLTAIFVAIRMSFTAISIELMSYYYQNNYTSIGIGMFIFSMGLLVGFVLLLKREKLFTT